MNTPLQYLEHMATRLKTNQTETLAQILKNMELRLRVNPKLEKEALGHF